MTDQSTKSFRNEGGSDACETCAQLRCQPEYVELSSAQHDFAAHERGKVTGFRMAYRRRVSHEAIEPKRIV